MADELTHDELMATLTRLSATLEIQRETIARQQEALAELQRQVADRQDAGGMASSMASGAAEEMAPAGEHVVATSRRGLLLGAAAATVGVAALGAATPTAHAASGGNLILGQSNDANATTTLAFTSGTTPSPILTVQAAASTTVANYAITGKSSGGVSVSGQDSANGIGVSGNGLGTLAIGVQGLTDSGSGVVGSATTGIDIAASGTGRLLQKPQAQVGPPSGTFKAGESIRDGNGELWLCLADGTPGVWVQVIHLAPGVTSGGAINYLAKPIRLFDSRSGATDAHQTPGVKCSSAATTSVQVSGVTYNGVTVPAKLVGAVGNVTVLNASGSGYIELVPKGAGFTGAANIAFGAGQVLSNAYNVGLTGGALDIVIGGSGTVTVDVIVDVFAVVA